MQEFIRTGNEGAFRALKQQLDASPGTIRVYSGVRLPASCSPDTVRLGFRAQPTARGMAYTVFIDRIAYTGSNYLFRKWVIDGDWTFPNFEAMTTFFHTQLKGL